MLLSLKHPWIGLTFLCLLTLFSGTIQAQGNASNTPTVIDFYTMGPGEDLFSAWGHAALCVHDATHPKGRCYNYGSTDFSNPPELMTNFVLGEAEFWVSVGSLDRMLYVYEVYNRSVWRQRIPLSETEAQEAAQRLKVDALPENRGYVYDHLRDNCSTRLRDHVDLMLEGALAKESQGVYPAVFRDEVLRGLSAYLPIPMFAQLMVGSSVDRPITTWEAMYLPKVMREQLETKLNIQSVVVRERNEPTPSGDPRSGDLLLLGLALFLAVSIGAGAKVSAKIFTASVMFTGLLFGLLSVIIWALNLSSQIPELVSNQTLIFWWPTDFILLGLRGRRLKHYALLRIGSASVVFLFWAVGALTQPLWAPILLIVLPMAAIYFSIPETPGKLAAKFGLDTQ